MKDRREQGMTPTPRQQVSWPQVWPKRQAMPQQRAMEPAPIEGVERTNAVVVRNQEQEQRIGLPRRDSYAMKVDRGRNCYVCSGFGHIAQHCRNRGERIRIGDGRRLEYIQKWGRERNYGHQDN